MNLDKPKPKSTFETHIPKSIGIIVNLFESLEPRAYENLSNGLCETKWTFALFGQIN